MSRLPSNKQRVRQWLTDHLYRRWIGAYLALAIALLVVAVALNMGLSDSIHTLANEETRIVQPGQSAYMRVSNVKPGDKLWVRFSAIQNDIEFSILDGRSFVLYARGEPFMHQPTRNASEFEDIMDIDFKGPLFLLLRNRHSENVSTSISVKLRGDGFAGVPIRPISFITALVSFILAVTYVVLWPISGASNTKKMPTATEEATTSAWRADLNGKT